MPPGVCLCEACRIPLRCCKIVYRWCLPHIKLSLFNTTLTHYVRLPINLVQSDEAIEALLKGVVMTDDNELLEATHTADLIGKVHAPELVHVRGGLVEEGNAERREFLEQGQT